MPFASPARRIAACLGVVAALAGGGAAIAATGGTEADSIEGAARAAAPAVRVTTTIAGASSAPAGPTTGGTLLFPMNPLPRCFVLDNFGDGRGGGRAHAGTDIMATLGQEVYAVDDGVLTSQVVNGQVGSELSGNAWTLRATDKDVFKFMHLSAFAAGLQVGSTAVKGQLIGYVGDTGNPGPGNYHLHFEVHPGGGAAVNAFGLLAIPASCSKS